MKIHVNKIDGIHSELRRRITSGKLVVGDLLPIETDLAAEFRCSTGTISKALALLKHEGLIERRTRAGTRVISPPDSPSSTASSEIAMNAFAFIFPTQQHEGIWRTVMGFQEAARDNARRAITLSTGLDLRKEAELISRLSEFDVKGAVIYPVLPHSQDLVHFSQMLLGCRFPIVLAEVNLPGMGFPAVVADGFHAGLTMTQRLLETGCRRIGFVSQYSWTSFMRDRHMGYCRAMEDAKLAIDPACVLLEPQMHPDFKDPLKEPTALARGFLQRNKGIEAIVAANDWLALGCIEAAREIGLSVPEDLKVVGIDDYALGIANHQELTTYHIPYEEIGRRAFAVLNDLLPGKTSPPMETMVRGHLVVRQTG